MSSHSPLPSSAKARAPLRRPRRMASGDGSGEEAPGGAGRRRARLRSGRQQTLKVTDYFKGLGDASYFSS